MISDEASRTPSRWREFRVVHNELCRAVEPRMGLSEVVRAWQEIKAGLAESRRRRRPQTESLQTS